MSQKTPFVRLSHIYLMFFQYVLQVSICAIIVAWWYIQQVYSVRI